MSAAEWRFLDERPAQTVAWEPRRPVYAAWTLEAEANAIVFAQCKGNESRIIGSYLWHFTPLYLCLEEIAKRFPWTARMHILASLDETYGDLFMDAHLSVDLAREVSFKSAIAITGELFPLLKIDREVRAWTDGRENNALLIDSLNGYRAPQIDSATFGKSPEHSWHVYLARALETFAVWRHDGGGAESSKNPNSFELERRRI